MDFFLFTYPNCNKCEELKNYMKERSLPVEEFSLVQKESKLRIRNYLPRIKRDEKGSIIIPTLVLSENEEVMMVVNSLQELEEWLKLKA